MCLSYCVVGWRWEVVRLLYASVRVRWRARARASVRVRVCACACETLQWRGQVLGFRCKAKGEFVTNLLSSSSMNGLDSKCRKA